MSVGEHDLVEHCRARLACFKKPRAVRFVASLPRSHYGKVMRAQLLARGALTRHSTLILASLMIFSYFAISVPM